MRWIICCATVGAFLAGCASTSAVQGAKEDFRAAKKAGAREGAPFEYYASKAYLELAQFASGAEDHGQARTWSEESKRYAAEATRLAEAAAAAKAVEEGLK